MGRSPGARKPKAKTPLFQDFTTPDPSRTAHPGAGFYLRLDLKPSFLSRSQQCYEGSPKSKKHPSDGFEESSQQIMQGMLIGALTLALAGIFGSWLV